MSIFLTIIKTQFELGACLSCKNNACAVMGYNSDKDKTKRGVFYLSTNDNNQFCGHHYLVEIKVSSDSPKTAGEIGISSGSSFKQLTRLANLTQNWTWNFYFFFTRSSINQDILAGGSIKRVISLSQASLEQVDSLSLNFKKKAKPLFGKDPNSTRFSISEIKMTNLQSKESWVYMNEMKFVLLLIVQSSTSRYFVCSRIELENNKIVSVRATRETCDLKFVNKYNRN